MSVPSKAPTPMGPFITTPHSMAQALEVPISDVLLAIETGELPVIRGTETLVQVRYAEAWYEAWKDRNTPEVEAAPVDGEPWFVGQDYSAPTVVNPLTGKVHHEVMVDMETGRPIRPETDR